MSKDLKILQVERMIKFMDHDAEEMAQNIEELSEENYETEKEKFVRQGMMEINQLYSKKMKLVNRETATMMATLMTDAKLEILRSRDMHIKSVMADVNRELLKMRSNKIQYKHILKMLILQAMYQLLEEDINLIVLSQDEEYVESIVEELQNTYKAETGMTVNINIEKHLKLPIEEIGGVMVTSKNRKIVVQNTLVMRLLYLGHLAIPIIRSGLFGPNPNRKSVGS